MSNNCLRYNLIETSRNSTKNLRIGVYLELVTDKNLDHFLYKLIIFFLIQISIINTTSLIICDEIVYILDMIKQKFKIKYRLNTFFQ
jgi:hypothetical protein